MKYLSRLFLLLLWTSKTLTSDINCPKFDVEIKHILREIQEEFLPYDFEIIPFYFEGFSSLTDLLSKKNLKFECYDFYQSPSRNIENVYWDLFVKKAQISEDTKIYFWKKEMTVSGFFSLLLDYIEIFGMM